MQEEFSIPLLLTLCSGRRAAGVVAMLGFCPKRLARSGDDAGATVIAGRCFLRWLLGVTAAGTLLDATAFLRVIWKQIGVAW